MPRLNFREVQDRFSHIDTRFITSDCDLKARTATYQVAFYPSWEHPLHVEAMREGKPWGFTDIPDEADRVVTVHAVELHEACLGRTYDVQDWWFTQADPRLWRFEDSADIVCNQNLDLATWLEILGNVRGGLKLTSEEPSLMGQSIEQVFKHGSSSSFSLGRFPYSVFVPLKAELEIRGIEIYIAREPDLKEVPILFTADGEDYLIAEDFEVDIPEFEHREEWFMPLEFRTVGEPQP
jgi:hypothetical protein